MLVLLVRKHVALRKVRFLLASFVCVWFRNHVLLILSTAQCFYPRSLLFLLHVLLWSAQSEVSFERLSIEEVQFLFILVGLCAVFELTG